MLVDGYVIAAKSDRDQLMRGSAMSIRSHFIAIGTPFYGNIPPRLIGPLTSNGLGRYSHRKESP